MTGAWEWWVAVWESAPVAAGWATFAIFVYGIVSGVAAEYVVGRDGRAHSEPRDWVAGALWPVWVPVRVLMWGAYVAGPFTFGVASALGWGTVAALRLLAGREPGGRP